MASVAVRRTLTAANPKVAALFKAIEDAIARDGANLVKQVKGVIVFVVQPAGTWVVDLKNGTGCVKQGDAPNADLTLTLKDDDFIALNEGKLNAQAAFMQGKLKIKGNMGLAMKLGTVIKAAQSQSKL